MTVRLRSGASGWWAAWRRARLPPKQADLVGARAVEDLVDGGGDVTIGVVLQCVVGVALVGFAPVEHPHVESGGEQVLDEAVTG
jgi:hypothetical protein